MKLLITWLIVVSIITTLYIVFIILNPRDMKKISAFGLKKDGVFKTIPPEELKKQINALPEGKYKITVEKWYKKSTPPQFGYLFGVVYPLSLEALNDAGYEFSSIEECDLFWKSIFANRQVLNQETGELVNIPQSKASFETMDMMTYCDNIRKYCAEYLGVNIPDPDPDYNLNKSFINQ
jgi:hypothetical protein